MKGVLRRKYAQAVRQRRHLATQLATPAKVDELAAKLEADGYVILNDIVDPQALDALYQAGTAKLARADQAARQQILSHKDFWTRLLDEDMENGTLPTDNPFVRYALQPAFLGVLARALGELPQLDYVLLTLSKSTGNALAYSQLWHRDHDDVRTIKLFAYLTDVADEADGPFTFIPGPASDRFGFSLRSHREDDAILKRVQPSEIKSMIAPKLTTFMVETSRCLHMGSRLAPGHSRLLYTATFITVPRLYPEPPSRFRFSGRETPLEQCVLTPAGN